MAVTYNCERCGMASAKPYNVKRIEIDLIAGEGGEGSHRLEAQGMFCFNCYPGVLAELKSALLGR